MDDYYSCPFNNRHQVLSFRMPGHIVKCKRNYRGPPLQECIYNACHLVPESAMAKHLEDCRDRHLFHHAEYEAGFRKVVATNK